MATKRDKITYTETILPEGSSGNVALDLGFQEEGNRWFVYRFPHLSTAHKLMFEKKDMQVYMPTYTTVQDRNGKKVTVDVPKIPNYIFVLTTIDKVRDFRATYDISPVLQHHIKGEILKADEVWVTIPNEQMHNLMLVAQGYEREVEFCTPDNQKLDKGDRVRVIAGHYKGVEGILIANQGSHRGGRIYISITNTVGVHTLHVPDEDIQVLEFSRNTNHFFRKLQDTEMLLDEVCQLRQKGEMPTSEQRAAMQFFLFRYSLLTGLSHVNRAKITACRYAINRLLGRHGEAQRCVQAYYKEVRNNKNSRRAISRWPSAQKYLETWISKIDSIFPADS